MKKKRHPEHELLSMILQIILVGLSNHTQTTVYDFIKSQCKLFLVDLSMPILAYFVIFFLMVYFFNF